EGFCCKGVDFSEGMLQLAKEKCSNTEFVKADVLNFVDDKLYDIVTCIDDSINHLGPFLQIEKFIKRVNKLLRPGGYFIFDSIAPDVLEISKEIIDLDDDEKLVFSAKKLTKDKILTETKYFFGDQTLGSFSNVEYYFPIEKLTSALENSGFVVESCSRDFPPIDEEKKFKIFARKH
ncbi:MAG: class I SAM-dependent methyltransferase, partial [Enterococcus sp.]|nr:class I SAM-dependent methyltransferase [Enterococcus sp.]